MTDRVVADEVGFTEGPVVDGDRLFVTSLDRGVIWSIEGETATELATLGGGPNGATLGLDGQLYVAQNGGVWPGQRTDGVTGGVQVVDVETGEARWLTQDMVAPNDLCFGVDGHLYVTDPTRRPARDDGRLWRCDPGSGEAELLCSVPWYPNGIAVGLDPAELFVASTGEAEILRLELLPDGRLGAPAPVVRMHRGHPDGFALDTDGNLYVCAISFGDDPAEVQVWDPEGRLLDTWVPGHGKFCTNVALDDAGTAYVCDSDGGRVLATDRWAGARPLPLPPFRSLGAG